MIKSSRVEEVMRRVDRGHFTPYGPGNTNSYIDSPQSIGFSATISAPHMVMTY